MTEILSYTMVLKNVSTMSIPEYATVRTRTAREHVYETLPRYLQGTGGVVDLIATFLGTSYIWMSVVCDLDCLYKNRNRDLYFVYDMFSRRLPMLPSLMETAYAFTMSNEDCRAPVGCIYTNVYTKPLSLGRDLYYTRSGHLGYKTELHRLVKVIMCHGYVTSSCPTLPTSGHHAIVTYRNRIHTWRHVPPCVQVIALEELSSVDTNLDWDSIVLDGIEPSVPSTLGVFPDSRHLSGRICREMTLIDRTFPRRYKTIYCTKTLSESKIIDSMFILQTTYEKDRFIPESFTVSRTRVLQVAETMFLNAVIRVPSQ